MREVRERLGLKKPGHLADAAGISVRMVNAVELGDRAGPKTLRAIARTLGWREQDVLDYVEGRVDTLAEPPDLPAPDLQGELAPLDEVLQADLDGLKKIARLWAHFEARREKREYKVADEERFMLWALKTRAENSAAHIEPPAETNRDVS